MKPLYISDLDGTLLNANKRISSYSIQTLHKLIERGVCFSYATARSLSSASVVAEGLRLSLPVVAYNGTMIVDASNGEVLSLERLDAADLFDVRELLKKEKIYPLVYSFLDGRERVSWLAGAENDGILHYIKERGSDTRLRKVNSAEELYRGEIFYITCIGEQQELNRVYERFAPDKRLTCVFQKELYREEFWLELMPRTATKAHAVMKLKKIAGCDRVVAFGDALNDLPLFQASDECYAVANAVRELKAAATGIIASNNEDGVARWLERNAVCAK